QEDAKKEAIQDWKGFEQDVQSVSHISLHPKSAKLYSDRFLHHYVDQHKMDVLKAGRNPFFKESELPRSIINALEKDLTNRLQTKECNSKTDCAQNQRCDPIYSHCRF